MYYSRRKIRRGGKKLKTRRRLGGAKTIPQQKPTAKSPFDFKDVKKVLSTLGIKTRKIPQKVERMELEPTKPKRVQPSREKKTIQRLDPSSKTSKAPRTQASKTPRTQASKTPATSAPKASRKRKMEVDSPKKEAITNKTYKDSKNYYAIINGILKKISEEKKISTLDEFKNEFFEKLNPNELTDNEFQKSLKKLSENDSVSPALSSIIDKLKLVKEKNKGEKKKKLEKKKKTIPNAYKFYTRSDQNRRIKERVK